MKRKLRYSERMRIAETGALAPLEHESVPPQLRQALDYVVGLAARRGYVGKPFTEDLHRSCVEHFGWTAAVSRGTWIADADLEGFLDFLEILAEEGARSRHYSRTAGAGVVRQSAAAFPDVEEKFNELADRHRFGYRLEGGEVRRVGSPALADGVVGPALLSAQRPGWENVERSFREALKHQRGPAEENDDALTAAGAALEAALKAAGITGNTLGQLATDFRRSDLAAPQLLEVPETLDKLLTRSAALRNIHGDAHGKAPGHDDQVPQELVDLAIHLVGAFIVYLEAADRLRRRG